MIVATIITPVPGWMEDNGILFFDWQFKISPKDFNDNRLKIRFLFLPVGH